MKIEAYIVQPRKWLWSYCDCTTFCADWVVEATGKDPAADLRGTYHTAEEAEAILQAHGGAQGLVDAKLRPLGFMRALKPTDGAIGIVRTATGFDVDGMAVKEIPAIKFGPLWAVMSARGPMVKQLDWTGVAWNIV